MYILAAVIMSLLTGLSDPEYGKAVAGWLAGQFTFLIIGTLQRELKERLDYSQYWDVFQERKECILGAVAIIIELSEFSW